MADSTPGPETFLSRWSRRKLAAARTDVAAPAGPAAAAPAPVAAVGASAPGDGASDATVTSATAASTPAPELPPVESLTFDSDFVRFLQPDVDAATRQAALRKLLRDPHFNVMDGLDTYIDDYSRPSPLAPEVVRQLAHARYLFSPPRTRINADGHVEDVPDEELPEAAAAEAEASGGDLPAAGSSGVDSAAVVTAVPGAALEARHLNPCATPVSTPAVPVGREDEEPSA